jgi:hypothetical protein
VGPDPLTGNVHVEKHSSDPSDVTRINGISQQFRLPVTSGGRCSEEQVEVHETAIRRPTARQDSYFFVACRRRPAESLFRSAAPSIGPFLVVDAEHDHVGQAVERSRGRESRA